MTGLRGNPYGRVFPGRARRDRKEISDVGLQVVTVAESAAREHAMSEWQPIATAPKDVLILLYGAKRMEFAVGMNHSRDGWVSDSTAEFLSMYPPTHWMPLPHRPKAA